jgi:adenine-specific DNA-methyltransferase
MKNKKERFYQILKDLFVGEAKIEGKGGYINLLRIKSKYYEKVKEEIDEEIAKVKERCPEFEEELYDKLYTFFKRYISESGAILFNQTPFHNNVYEKIYTDDEDVVLFWKTKNLYYVKTDRVFRSMPVEFDGLRFFFDASEIEYKKNNEKREVIYELQGIENGVVVFKVKYSERGQKTKTEEILKNLKRAGIRVSEEQLQNAFRIFEKQSEVDYFINKNAREFLKEQFKLWLYQYLVDGTEDWPKGRIDQLNILRNIAYKLIDLVAQFEEELVKIWNKPKFVINSNYVITLDRIAKHGEKGLEVIRKILNHPNLQEQIREWKELGIVDDSFRVEEVLEKDGLSEEYQFLPVDTKYFKDLEPEIIGLFDNLDQALDGWLIKSENYQALNTILNKFAGKIKVIYIDPPYNTGSDEFLYEDKHRHSSWLTMMENRLSLARGLLSDDGVIFISIGDTLRSQVRINSASRLQILCNQIFGEDNLIATLVRKSGIAPRQDIRHIANSHDYVLCYAKNIDRAKINRRSANISRLKYRDEHFNERGYFSLNQLDRGSIQYSESLDYPIIIEKGTIIEIFDGITFKKLPAPERIEIWPGGDPNDKRWIFRWSEEKVGWGIENDFIVFKKDRKGKWKVYYKEYELVDNEGRPRERTNPYDTLILEFPNELGTYEIDHLFNERVFEYPKPSELIKHLLKIGSCKDSLILDFFAGSGTTVHAVMKLNKEDGGNRKFILVEMADYFETVILPRIKKVAYSFNWKDGRPQDTDGLGVFFKYYELEQFEDTLAKVVYEDLDPLFITGRSIYEQYIFMRDKKMSDALELDYEKGNVRVDLSKLYDNIDIAETLSNLLGKWIKRITKDSVEFEDGTSVSLAQLDYKLIKPLIWW